MAVGTTLLETADLQGFWRAGVLILNREWRDYRKTNMQPGQTNE